MRVIRKRPGEQAEIINIDNSLHALQHEVGGGIDALASQHGDVVLIFNGMGKNLDAKVNIALESSTHKIVDCIYGTALIVGAMEDEFVSLDDATCDQYLKYLNEPNRTVSMPDECPVIRL